MINPQTSDLTAFYIEADDGTRKESFVDPTGTFVEEGTGDFDFQNRTDIRLYDDVMYDLEVYDEVNGGFWGYFGFQADTANEQPFVLTVEDPIDIAVCENNLQRDPGDCTGTATPTTFGTATVPPTPTYPPTPTRPPTATPGAPGTFPPLPTYPATFTRPSADPAPPEVYLDTRVINTSDGEAVEIRYFDPSTNTTEFTYEFVSNGTTVNGTRTFDEPVGSVTEIVPTPGGNEDPSGIEDIEFEFVQDGETFSGTLPFGEGGAAFDFSSAGPSADGGVVFAPRAPGGGDGGGLGVTAVLVVAGAGSAYYLRNPENRRTVAKAAGSAANTAANTLRRFRR